MAANRKQTVVNEDSLFTFIDHNTIESEKIIAPRYSYWKSVFRVFFRKKINWALLILFTILLLCSFIIPVFCKYDPNENVTNALMFHLSPSQAMAQTGGFSFKW